MPNIPCQQFPIPNPLEIILPGGINIQSVPSSALPSELDVANALISQMSSVVAPISSIFKIIAVLQAILETLESIPDAISFLSPGKITDALQKVQQRVGDLASLIPQLSVPVMIIGFIDLIISYLSAINSELEKIASELEKGDSARQAAESIENPIAQVEFLRIADCIDLQINQRLQAFSSNASAIDVLIGTINTFGSLVNLPEIPVLGNLGSDINSIQINIENTIILLQSIRSTIPIP
jgi:hypothetical protein